MLASLDQGRRPDSAAVHSSLSLAPLGSSRPIRLVGATDSYPAVPSAPPARAPSDAPAAAPRIDVPDPAAIDLRRRGARAGAESLLLRARYAAPSERALVRAVFARGATVGEVARAAGLCPRTVRRHLKKVIVRLLSARFAFVVGHMGSWPDERRRIALATVVRGLSARAASIRLGLSLHRVRAEIARIDASFEAQRALARGTEHSWRDPTRSRAILARIGPAGKKEGTP